MSRSRVKEATEAKEALKIAYTIHHAKIPDTLNYTGTQLAVAWGEILAGVALLLGLLTRLSALAMIIVQVGALATVTWAKGFALEGGVGYEYNVALMAMCLAVALTGGGNLSVDRLIWRPHRHRAAQTAQAPVPVAS